MVNPVNSQVNQATLNPFQKRIEDQIKNPERRDTQESAQANASRSEERRENQPVAQARNDNEGNRQDARAQRGSLLDVTV